MRFTWRRRPADYRAKADRYLMKARLAPDFMRRERYSQLAAVYLETAQRLEKKDIDATLVNPSRRGSLFG
jgi:hypothetical protein